MAENGKYFIIVDMQNDFVYGSLGSGQARAIVPEVAARAEAFDGTVIFTQDTHHEDYLKTQEGKELPVEHCVEGTDGWRLIEELSGILEQRSCPVYKKETFGCLELAENLRNIYLHGGVESVELAGVCTDICVVSCALLLKAYLPETPIVVDSKCCAGVTREKHEAALETMRSCQIKVL